KGAKASRREEGEPSTVVVAPVQSSVKKKTGRRQERQRARPPIRALASTPPASLELLLSPQSTRAPPPLSEPDEYDSVGEDDDLHSSPGVDGCDPQLPMPCLQLNPDDAAAPLAVTHSAAIAPARFLSENVENPAMAERGVGVEKTVEPETALALPASSLFGSCDRPYESEDYDDED
ncbi:unnamed protein product, partial [Sphacelaria rigidula]